MSNGSYLQALWQVCLINILHFLQLSSSLQTGHGWGIESPQSTTRHCTKYCWAAEGEEAWASRSSLDELGCTQELLSRDIAHFCPCCLQQLLISLQKSFTKMKPALHLFLPIDAKFSSYSFINHSMFHSKIMGVIILLLRNICQDSLLTIKVLLFLINLLLKLHF